ncbi:MAG: hypothetical protein LBK67_09380, partial [Coriobacteriales bacterium]|nr:hypothetical protein [Coriobacteriales bacterium]
NIFMISQGEYYAAATGLLFGFTYFFQAMNGLFKIDTRPYGWFSLFVAINTIPCAIIDYQAGDPAMAVIWLAWGVLWFTGWVECVAKKDLKHFVSVLLILEGIFSAWIPGFLMLRDMWPWG